MADSISIDTSEVRALAADISRSVTRVAPEVRKVVLVGAMKIKKQMRAEMGSSESFKGTVNSIDFDMRGNAFYTEAVIGPKVGSGEKGGLAGIAYFGNSRGGGTVSDPQGALDAETPHFERALLDVLGGLL
ncbi:MAG TPA: hypothetical protein VFE45_06920 [Coriobacteriia bacterium]|nr:hypothetical protein [Coriobacteriia bacterium]